MLLSEKMKFLGEMFTFAVFCFFFPPSDNGSGSGEGGEFHMLCSWRRFHFVAQAGLEITL